MPAACSELSEPVSVGIYTAGPGRRVEASAAALSRYSRCSRGLDSSLLALPLLLSTSETPLSAGLGGSEPVETRSPSQVRSTGMS